MSALVRLLDACVALTLEVLPFLAIGSLIAATLQVFEDRLRLGARLADSAVGILAGALLGCVAPVCSCGAVPVAVGLLSGGVPPGPVFAFLAAAPVVNPVSFAATAGLLGYPIALGRLVGALVLGVLCGFLLRRARGFRSPRPGCCSGAGCGCSPTPPSAGGGAISMLAPRRRCQQVLFLSGETLVGLLPYLAAGVLIGGLLSAFLDERALARYLAGPASVAAAALASLPLYICSCSEVPIALSVVEKGLPPGAVLAFLLAGPGVSAFSIAMLASFLRPREIALYVSVFLAGSIAFGLLWLEFVP